MGDTDYSFKMRSLKIFALLMKRNKHDLSCVRTNTIEIAHRFYRKRTHLKTLSRVETLENGALTHQYRGRKRITHVDKTPTKTQRYVRCLGRARNNFIPRAFILIVIIHYKAVPFLLICSKTKCWKLNNRKKNHRNNKEKIGQGR